VSQNFRNHKNRLWKLITGDVTSAFCLDLLKIGALAVLKSNHSDDLLAPARALSAQNQRVFDGRMLFQRFFNLLNKNLFTATVDYQ
tara:strand:+ start:2040 stop:2297 length:258 start_codon:yes stop_codon:yes gene_type:complete